MYVAPLFPSPLPPPPVFTAAQNAFVASDMFARSEVYAVSLLYDVTFVKFPSSVLATCVVLAALRDQGVTVRPRTTHINTSKRVTSASSP